MSLPTFDESWHRVAPRRIRLRPGVEIFPQSYRGERWYVVRDALSAKFFRVREPAYRFICELERHDSVESAWHQSLTLDAENAPGQGEVVMLLSQLHRAGLIRSDREGDAAGVVEALEAEKTKESVQRWSSIMFFRIPLWNPDKFLRNTLSLFRWLISPLGAVLWLVLFAAGLREVLVNWQLFRQEGSGFLGLANLPWMYAVMVVIKAAHEFGHGYMCRRYGGEVPETGLMLLLFNPLPYVDASASTAFRSKWQRILVASAGMLVEIAIAAACAIIWAHSGSGKVHVLAYNAVMVASIVTVLFNANPLLRYDGYHILSDWLEIPNLQQRATQMGIYLVHRYLFGMRQERSPADTRRESWMLGVYYFASLIYRTFMVVGILLYISQRYLVLGAILGIVFGFMWVLLPVLKAIAYLWTSPKLESCRLRACSVSFGLVAALLAFLALVPMPNHFRAEAVVRADPFNRVYSGADGRLDKVLVTSGQLVNQGDALLLMSNTELDHDLELLNAEQAQAEAQARLSLEEDPAQYKSMATYFRALEARRAKLLADKAALTIRAPSTGRWLAPDITLRLGVTMPRGLELGIVQGEQRYFVSAVVKQDEVSRLFTSEHVRDTRVKIRGQEGVTLSVSDFIAIPSEREALPSAALGILGGGTTDVKNRAQDNRNLPGPGMVEAEQGRGTYTKEPVFELRATLQPSPLVTLVHGQRAVTRLALTPEPLLWQWTRQVRQVFLKDYQM
jgi:putative peptide zinc metalloprotease protein